MAARLEIKFTWTCSEAKKILLLSFQVLRYLSKSD
jgi:hypothetical protein